MKTIPETSDLQELQRQITAIYDHLKVTPVVICKTYGMGYTLIPRGHDKHADDGLITIDRQFSRS